MQVSFLSPFTLDVTIVLLHEPLPLLNDRVFISIDALKVL